MTRGVSLSIFSPALQQCNVASHQGPGNEHFQNNMKKCTDKHNFLSVLGFLSPRYLTHVHYEYLNIA